MKHLFFSIVSAFCFLVCSGLPTLADSRMQAASSAPIRARPDASSPVLATANPGEIFFADHAEGAWTAVAPPDRVALWIHSDFVEGTRVVAKTVQLRTAPSLSSDVAGSLSRGATILQRGKQGDWLQIAPPSSSHVYIETSSLSPVAERTEPVREIPETPGYIPEPTPVAPPPPVVEAVPAAPEPFVPDYTYAPPPQAPAPEPEPLPTPSIAASVPGSASSRPVPQTTHPAPPSAAPSRAASPVPASAAPSSSLAIAPSVPAPDSPAPASKPAVSHSTPPTAATSRGTSSSAPAHHAARPAAPPAEHVTPPSELRRPLAEAPARSPHTPAVAPSKPASAPPSTRPSPIVVDQALIDELNLVDTPNQGKAVKVEGELRLAPFTKGSPSRYRLLVHGPHSAQMLCHVHGHSSDLRPYIGRIVSIRGKAFRVADSDMPVVVVGKLVPVDPDPDPDAEGVRF